MSITPTATIRSASPRPYAGARGAASSVSTMLTGSLRNPSFAGSWVCFDHMTTEHTTTTGSKRLGPGSFVGVLT